MNVRKQVGSPLWQDMTCASKHLLRMMKTHSEFSTIYSSIIMRLTMVTSAPKSLWCGWLQSIGIQNWQARIWLQTTVNAGSWQQHHFEGKCPFCPEWCSPFWWRYAENTTHVLMCHLSLENMAWDWILLLGRVSFLCLHNSFNYLLHIDLCD